MNIVTKNLVAIYCFFLLPTLCQGQIFEKYLGVSSPKSITQNGQNMSVEACQDSSKLTFVVNSDGDILQNTQYFKGSCENGFIMTQLNDSNFISFGRNDIDSAKINKFDKFGNLLYSKNISRKFSG